MVAVKNKHKKIIKQSVKIPNTASCNFLPMYVYVGLSRGTRGTRSPSYPTHFHSPIPRGMNFGSPRFPDSPPIIPRFPEHWKISRKNWIISEKMNKIRKKKIKKLGGNLKNANFSYIHPILVDFLKKYTLIPYIVLKSLV